MTTDLDRLIEAVGIHTVETIIYTETARQALPTPQSGPNRNGSYEDRVMASKPLPSQEVLRQLLDYDPETGALTWRARPASMFRCTERSPDWAANRWNAQWAGKPGLSTLKGEGYLGGWLMGRTVKAHRVIWKMMTGKDPEIVDHINGRKSDNRWENLRSVSFNENVRNAKLRKDNTTGKPGVRHDRRDGKYYVTGKVKGKSISLGSFTDLSDAIASRDAWEVAQNFHPNHGRTS